MIREDMNPGHPQEWFVVLGLLFLTMGCGTKAEPSSAPESPVVSAPTSAMACQVSERCDQLFCDQVCIPGGTFSMGSDMEPGGAPPEYFGGLKRLGDPRPAHTVDLAPFCIDKYEVTVERYEACVKAGACDPGWGARRETASPLSFQTHVNHYPDHCRELAEHCPTCPVNCRSYEQAWDYCEWIGRRLCTEAEWERAASGPGPAKRPYPWGDGVVDPSRANIAGVGPGHVLPVSSCPSGASLEGVFNLAGNVFEWVEDPYREYLNIGEGDPKAGAGWGMLVGRGGCFHTGVGYASWDRTTFHPDFDWGCIGIRCCADPIRTDEPQATLPKIEIRLPGFDDGASHFTLRHLLEIRQSTREFGSEALTLDEASRLLWAGQGITRPDGGRAAPSAGALYPLELLLVASRVEGIESGVYRYEAANHALSLLAAGGRAEPLHLAALAQQSIVEAAAVIVILGVNERTAIKYGDRAERYVLLEAGHAAQNILLQAAELDLGAVPIGAFDDAEVRRILGTAAAPIYLIPVGRPRT